VTRDEAIGAYSEMFGGFPYFMVMGMPDEELVPLVEKALESGKEIEFEIGDDVY